MSESSSIIKKIVNWILNVFITIFFIILLISIFTNIQVTLLKNSYATFFGFSIFEVQTGSMEPAIQTGDCVIVKMANEFNTNDIVTFEQNGEFITHRIIEAYKGTYVTKGDANNAKDDPISREQIVGKVIKTLPKIGLLRNTLMNPGVLIALIITLYFISLVFKDRKRKNNEIKEVDKKMKIFEKIKSLIHRKKDTVDSSNNNQEIISSRIEDYETKIDNKYIESFQNEQDADIQEKIEEPVIIETIEAEDTVTIDDSNMENISSSEDDLDKTMYFRMISVVEDDLIEPTVQISPKEIQSAEDKKDSKKEKNKKKEDKSPKNKKAEKEEPQEEITKELDIIAKKRKKFKNIIEKVMFIKEDELSEIIDAILKDEKNKTNMTTIKNIFIKSYIDAKYYNYCGNINVEYNKKNMTTKVNMALEEKAEEMIKSYKGSDKKYADKVEKLKGVFTLIIYLEQAFLVEEGIRSKRENYKSKILKLMKDEYFEGPILTTLINDILLIQKTHQSYVKTSIEKLDTNTFKLVTNPIAKNITGVYLEHNIAFSKVYSDYIVDKTYQEGVIAEDKIAVLITLLSANILNDMMTCNFNQKYLFYIPESLYAKANKLSALFDKFEDEYAKTCLMILVQYDELSKNSKVIRSLIKEGYKFAVDMSKTEKIKSKDMGVMELMSKIFIDRKTKEKKAMLSVLSENAQTRVITDDVEAKVGSFWGVE